MKYCTRVCDVHPIVVLLPVKMKMAQYNSAGYGKHFRGKKLREYKPVDALGNREGVVSNRAPPRNF